MDFLTGVYFGATFVALYFLMLYVLTYVKNKKRIYEVIKPDKIRSLSIVIPCYNAKDSIGETIECHLNADYPGLKKIIVSDDCSTDGSDKVIKEYAKKYSKVLYVKTPKNTGNAAGAKNYGSKFVKTELIGFSDDDSKPKKNAISNMVGFFNDDKVGAVTSRVLVNGRENFLVRSQAIEYKIMAFTRKLLGFLDSIYVTNGPLSIYRKRAYDDVGGFDSKNLTEDIEITWHFVRKGWKVHMAMSSLVYTNPPTTIKIWFKQRIRWNVGGIQTANKYRNKLHGSGMLGKFIFPFFLLGWSIGIVGLGFLVYRFVKYISMKFLVAKYSVASEVALVTLDSFKLNPSILFVFGIALFSLSFMFTLVALAYSKENGRIIGHKLRDIFIYSFFYLLAYPPLLITAFVKYARGYNTWGGHRFEDAKE
jgi:poly-beta-1,6-N-acetyl-D-glucosamine synthase